MVPSESYCAGVFTESYCAGGGGGGGGGGSYKHCLLIFFISDEEHVDFQSLYQAVQNVNHQQAGSKDPDSVSIVEVEPSVSFSQSINLRFNHNC